MKSGLHCVLRLWFLLFPSSTSPFKPHPSLSLITQRSPSEDTHSLNKTHHWLQKAFQMPSWKMFCNTYYWVFYIGCFLLFLPSGSPFCFLALFYVWCITGIWPQGFTNAKQVFYFPTSLFLVLLGPLQAFFPIVSPLLALRLNSGLIALFKEHILFGQAYLLLRLQTQYVKTQSCSPSPHLATEYQTIEPQPHTTIISNQVCPISANHWLHKGQICFLY